jgi:sugar O-acyltransferase (sialic acid O-acetyltransferase NeuD family)
MLEARSIRIETAERAVKKKLYIFGIQNFAEMCHYLFSTDSDYDLAGFTVDAKYLDRSTFCGLPVIAYEEFCKTVSPETADVFVAVGVSKINTLRAAKVEQVQKDGYRLASFVASSSPVGKDLVVGPNTMIMDHVLVHPQVQIGADTVIWTGSRIALKVRIGEHCWITSAIIGDSATIGEYTFIGLNATVAPFVKVGSHNLIGAAAVILQDTKDYAVYRGPRSKPSPVSSLRIRNIPLIH